MLLVFFMWLSGCATHRAYFVHESTDLGVFQHGRERAATEVVTGIPDRIEYGEQGYTAYYLYDRSQKAEEHTKRIEKQCVGKDSGLT
jgi:hypothetical protein